jgi:hypothetical protein
MRGRQGAETLPKEIQDFIRQLNGGVLPPPDDDDDDEDLDGGEVRLLVMGRWGVSTPGIMMPPIDGPGGLHVRPAECDQDMCVVLCAVHPARARLCPGRGRGRAAVS